MYKKERWGRVSVPAHASLRRGRGRGRRRGGNPNELRPLDATVEGVHPIPKFCRTVRRMNGTRTISRAALDALTSPFSHQIV